jgi:hypothetical protein
MGPGSLTRNASRPARTGTVAIYTDHVKVSHIIRRVLLRQVAILKFYSAAK